MTDAIKQHCAEPRQKKSGPPLQISKRQMESFRRRITIEGEHWLYNAASARKRDDFSIRGMTWSASRVMWSIYRGVPKGKVRRYCGVPHCVRPSHHREGLHPAKVAILKELYATKRYTIEQLAAQAGYSHTTISDALLDTNRNLKKQLRSVAKDHGKTFRNAYLEENAADEP